MKNKVTNFKCGEGLLEWLRRFDRIGNMPVRMEQNSVIEDALEREEKIPAK